MNTLQDDEKLKLQEKLGKKIKQYDRLMETVHEMGLEYIALNENPKTIQLRQAYNEVRKELAELCSQTESLSLQAKKIKKEIDEIQNILCPKRKRKRNNGKNENDMKEKEV